MMIRHRNFSIRSILLMIVLSLFVLGLGLVASAQEATHTDEPPHWDYTDPAGWGALGENAEYALCASGQAQSPIDISGAQELSLSDIEFNYAPSALNIFNNGHTIEVEYAEGSSITYNEIEYNLKQFHFHTPSEHQVNGETFGMELHFVHKDANGALAVVGVLLRETDVDNPAFADIFARLPAEKGEPEPTELTINAADLLPVERLFTTYVGSLTTPPCSQGVRWLVLSEPVALSSAQIDAFAAIFALNARPVQDLNTRDLLEDASAGS